MAMTCAALVLGFALTGTEATALFLLGDSTSARLYKSALIPLCDGVPDPRTNRTLENVFIYKLHGMVCKPGFTFSRIGFMFHWGVANANYHGGWVSHRTPGDTDNSVSNMMSAMDEFQMRSIEDEKVVFLFLSNIWDATRYTTKLFEQYSLGNFLNDQSTNYERVIRNLQMKLRPKDHLLLQTCHLPMDPRLLTSMTYINDNIRRTSKKMKIDLFDEAKLLEPNCWEYKSPVPGHGCHREHLDDAVHQTPESSRLISSVIELYIRGLPHEFLTVQ